MTEQDLLRVIERKRKSGKKVFCAVCGNEIHPEDDLAGVQYVRTVRRTELFFQPMYQERFSVAAIDDRMATGKEKLWVR